MRALKPLTAAIVMTVLAGEVSAQRALEEVIVTATKRVEGLQDIAVTVNAFSAETIQDAGIQNASDVAVLTPSLNISVNTSPFNARMSVRGVGTAQTDPALEPSVGLFVDGVFIGRTGLGMSDLTDIERIEVLQGPQGTLYGKNTNAGAISIITMAPNFEEYEGYVDASAGNYAMGRLTASASGPVSETLAFRASGSTHQRGGFYDNNVGDDLNDADDWNLMGKLQWEPADTLSVVLSASHVERDSTCCAADAVQNESVNAELIAQGLNPDGNEPYDYDVSPDIDNHFTMESDLLSLTLNYDTFAGEIVSITAWNDYAYSLTQDPDRSQLDILQFIDDKSAGNSLSQEFRFTATAGENVDYQVGLFYYEQTTKRGGNDPFVFLGEDIITIGSQQALPFPPGISIDFLAQPGDALQAEFKQVTETIALFSQATWHIDDRWHITGGLRWTDEEKKSDLLSQTISTAPAASILGRSFLDSVSTPIDATLERSSDNLDWLIRASADIHDDTMVFVSASTGTKSGGFNSVSGEVDAREFDDEDTLTFELGVKSTLLASRLRINATAFYSEITEYQAQQQLETGLGTFVSNAAEVETSGIDLQVDALPLPNLTISAGLLYMHEYEITKGPDKGLNLPYTADYSGNIATTVVFPLADGAIYWRTDLSIMDDHSTNVASADNLQDSDFDDRTLLNMKLGWRNNNWNVSVWGKNLTDDEYASQTAAPFLLSGMDAYFLAPPLTWGATVRYDF